MHNDPDTNSLPQWDDTQSPFRIPDGYFDTLTARVMHNIPAQPAAEPVKKKEMDFDPEEMVIYSEVMKPGYEKY